MGTIETMRREVTTYRQGLQAEHERLRLEAEAGKIENRYARRTWLAATATLMFLVLNIGDAARAYAHNPLWDLVFWPSHHHAGAPSGLGWLQVVGFAWQALALSVLIYRTQLPPWLADRVDNAQMSLVPLAPDCVGHEPPVAPLTDPMKG